MRHKYSKKSKPYIRSAKRDQERSLAKHLGSKAQAEKGLQSRYVQLEIFDALELNAKDVFCPSCGRQSSWAGRCGRCRGPVVPWPSDKIVKK